MRVATNAAAGACCGGVPQDSQQTEQPPDLGFRHRAMYVVLVAAAAFAGLFLLWELKGTFALIFAAVLVAVFFRAGGDVVARALPFGRHAKGVGLAAFALSLVALIAVFVFWVGPTLSEQADALREKVPQAYADARDRVTETGWGRWLFEDESGPNVDGAVMSGGDMGRRAMRVLSTLVWVVTAGVFLLFTGLYLAIEPGLYQRGVEWLVPARGRKHGASLLTEMGQTLRYWLGGQLVAMALVAVLSGVGLWILGVPLPLGNAAITFVLVFIPNFGPVASGVVPVLLALSTDGRFFDAGPTNALAVVGLYFGVQAVESYLVTPLIQKRAVELPPALLITTQIILGTLVGLVGVAIAAPLTAVLMVAVRRLVVEGKVESEDPLDSATD